MINNSGEKKSDFDFVHEIFCLNHLKKTSKPLEVEVKNTQEKVCQLSLELFGKEEEYIDQFDEEKFKDKKRTFKFWIPNDVEKIEVKVWGGGEIIQKLVWTAPFGEKKTVTV